MLPVRSRLIDLSIKSTQGGLINPCFKAVDAFLRLHAGSVFSAILFLLAMFITISPLQAESGEQKLYRQIKIIPLSDTLRFEKESESFIKQYPASKLIPDVRLLQAEREKDIDLAAGLFSSIVKKYPDFDKRDYALYRLCQILDLKSKWKELETESARAVKLFPNGKFAMEFRLMRAASLIMLEDFDSCREECIRITESTHDFEILARATRIMAEVERKVSGNSKSYISLLRELVTGFSESQISPSILYSLGLYYEQKRDKDKAYSAYSDILKKYPDSPEADMALNGIESLKQEKPSYVKYLPDNETVNEADTIDIEPDYQPEDAAGKTYYSVSIGPFTKRRDTEKIIRLLGSYEDSHVVKTGAGYTIFLGRFPGTDSALAVRIRLAEEYGINGEIVRFSKNKSKSYIYGD